MSLNIGIGGLIALCGAYLLSNRDIAFRFFGLIMLTIGISIMLVQIV